EAAGDFDRERRWGVNPGSAGTHSPPYVAGPQEGRDLGIRGTRHSLWNRGMATGATARGERNVVKSRSLLRMLWLAALLLSIGSAEFHSAVSQVFNLQTAHQSTDTWSVASAEQSQDSQINNLRYGRLTTGATQQLRVCVSWGHRSRSVRPFHIG